MVLAQTRADTPALWAPGSVQAELVQSAPTAQTRRVTTLRDLWAVDRVEKFVASTTWQRRAEWIERQGNAAPVLRSLSLQAVWAAAQRYGLESPDPAAADRVGRASGGTRVDPTHVGTETPVSRLPAVEVPQPPPPPPGGIDGSAGRQRAPHLRARAVSVAQLPVRAPQQLGNPGVRDLV